MEMGKVYQCLEMGVVGGMISRDDVNEVRGLLEKTEGGGEVMLTRKQAAKLTNVHHNSLDRFARTGVITKIHTAVGPRYRRSEIMSLLTTEVAPGKRGGAIKRKVAGPVSGAPRVKEL